MTINFNDTTEDTGQESIKSEYWYSYSYFHISFMLSIKYLSKKNFKKI